MNRRFKLIIKLVLIISCGCFILIEYFTATLFDAPKGYYGVPAISTDYPDLNMNIQQVVDDGSRIYILFDSYRRIVQVYDLNGKYQHTLFFYSNYDNGVFTVATEENTLYVEDECGNVYIFIDGVFDRFYKTGEASLLLADIEFDWKYSSEQYEIRNGSLWKHTSNGEVCLIEQKSSRTKSISLLLIAVLFVVTLIDLIYRKAEHQ